MDTLAQFVDRRRHLLVITGAGCSAASGIPTYRNEKAQWQRSSPIQHKDFVTDPASRRRYWARSFAGWPPVRDAAPNDAHDSLAELERRGIVNTLVTQNVDRLHQKAGHRTVHDLHGRLDEVVCLDCGDLFQRETMQQRLAALNPGLAPTALEITPDGDAEVASDLIERIVIPDCEHCGGILKPNVVFFGGSVERARVAAIYDAVASADGILVVGSTLMVFSSYRFCRRAAEQDKPIAIVNLGRTRADELATLKVEADCVSALTALID